MRALYRILVIGLVVVGFLAIGVMAWRWPRPIPIATAETVFVYSPHPDDETYAMGQAITEQVLAGHRVVGVLMTDGEGSTDVPEWIDSKGRDVDQDGDIDRWDFGLARRAEYKGAMQVLGADELLFLGASGSQGKEGFLDGDLHAGKDAVAIAVESVIGTAAPNSRIAHMTVAKTDPGHPFRGEPREHPDHTGLSDAIYELATSRHEEVFLYKVYIFYEDRWWNRWTTKVVQGSEEAHERKIEAIEEYREMGQASTPAIWNSSYESRVEYLAVAEDGE